MEAKVVGTQQSVELFQVALIGARRQSLAQHVLAFSAEGCRLVAADKHGVIRREHHVEQLAHVIARSVQVVFDHMRQAMLFKTFLQLFDSLGTNALDAKQVVFGVPNHGSPT